jgi:hypothetical protein
MYTIEDLKDNIGNDKKNTLSNISCVLSEKNMEKLRGETNRNLFFRGTTLLFVNIYDIWAKLVCMDQKETTRSVEGNLAHQQPSNKKNSTWKGVVGDLLPSAQSN